MKIHAKTDKGMVRELNQDVVDYGNVLNDLYWVLVCDGMGGQNSGDVASFLACNTIKNLIETHYNSNLTELELKELMTKCLNAANTEIFNKSQQESHLKGMGTTAVLAFIKDNILKIAYVGDSRAYSVLKDDIVQLTVDHSMVQEMLNSGEITEDEAKVHPRRNIITRALGMKPDLEIDYVEKEFLKDSALLVCTDGFSNYINKDLILDYFSKFSGETLVDELIKYANNSGGKDNITVAIVTH